MVYLPDIWKKSGTVLGLRKDMDDLFDRFFSNWDMKPVQGTDQVWTPAIDIEDEQEKYVVTADMPGVDVEDINISVQNSTLLISGERKYEAENKEKKFHRIERAYGAFRRTITLPENVDSDKITATNKNGVLKVILPKTKQAMKRQIEIKSE